MDGWLSYRDLTNQRVLITYVWGEGEPISMPNFGLGQAEH